MLLDGKFFLTKSSEIHHLNTKTPTHSMYMKIYIYTYTKNPYVITYVTLYHRYSLYHIGLETNDESNEYTFASFLPQTFYTCVIAPPIGE